MLSSLVCMHSPKGMWEVLIHCQLYFRDEKLGFKQAIDLSKLTQLVSDIAGTQIWFLLKESLTSSIWKFHRRACRSAHFVLKLVVDSDMILIFRNKMLHLAALSSFLPKQSKFNPTQVHSYQVVDSITFITTIFWINLIFF